MSNTTILNKISYADLQAFLTPYHQRLHEVESFPPLNPNKSMHIAAKSLGLKNAHVMKAQMDAANTQSGYDHPTQSGYDVWEDDTIQFARLVAEFGMAADSENVSLKDVSESMDLDMPEIFTLFARAERAFETIKAGNYPAPVAEPQSESVIVIVFHEKEDSMGGSATHTDMDIARDMSGARKIVGDRVHQKGMERADADRVDELFEFSGVTTPDEDDDIDLSNAEEVLDWIIEYNGIYDLANYLEYLDYDLTTVSIETKFL